MHSFDFVRILKPNIEMALPVSNLSSNTTYVLQGISAVTLIGTMWFIYSIIKYFEKKLGNKWYKRDETKPALLAIITWICSCIYSIVAILSTNDTFLNYSSDNYDKDCLNGKNCTICLINQNTANVFAAFVASISYIVALQTLCGALKASSIAMTQHTKRIIDIIQVAVVINGILLTYLGTLNIKDKQIFELNDNSNVHVCLDIYDRATVYLAATASITILSMGIGISMSILFISKLRTVYVEYHLLTKEAPLNIMELSHSVTDVVIVKKQKSQSVRSKNDKIQDKLNAIVCDKQQQNSNNDSDDESQSSDSDSKTNEIKMRVKFGPVFITTNDINLAQNKQLQSILNVMARYTVVVITYVIIRVTIGNVVNTVLKFPNVMYGYVFTTFAAATWTYFLFPSGANMYGKFCYLPHKCVILCLLNSTSHKVKLKKTISGVELQTLQQKVSENKSVLDDTENLTSTYTDKSTVGSQTEA